MAGLAEPEMGSVGLVPESTVPLVPRGITTLGRGDTVAGAGRAAGAAVAAGVAPGNPGAKPKSMLVAAGALATGAVGAVVLGVARASPTAKAGVGRAVASMSDFGSLVMRAATVLYRGRTH